MTEYDYSPGAYKRFQQQQQRVGVWSEFVGRVPPADPFTPPTPAASAADLPRSKSPRRRIPSSDREERDKDKAHMRPLQKQQRLVATGLWSESVGRVTQADPYAPPTPAASAADLPRSNSSRRRTRSRDRDDRDRDRDDARSSTRDSGNIFGFVSMHTLSPSPPSEMYPQYDEYFPQQGGYYLPISEAPVVTDGGPLRGQPVQQGWYPPAIPRAPGGIPFVFPDGPSSNLHGGQPDPQSGEYYLPIPPIPPLIPGGPPSNVHQGSYYDDLRVPLSLSRPPWMPRDLGPAFNPVLWASASSIPGPTGGPGPLGSDEWDEERRRRGLPNRHLKARSYLRPPSAEYLATKLSANGLGLLDMTPVYEIYGDEAGNDSLDPDESSEGESSEDASGTSDDASQRTSVIAPGQRLGPPPNPSIPPPLYVPNRVAPATTHIPPTSHPSLLHDPRVQSETRGTLEDRQALGYINSLLASWERRRPLLAMIMLPDVNSGLSPDELRESLEDVEAQINTFLTHILNSGDAKRAAKRLEGGNAQSFIDAIQDVLDRGTLPNAHSRSKARRLMQKVSEAHEQLPSSIFISGVNDHDEHPTFGGGFGDVYRASYQGKMVALKRIRTFTADSTTHRNRLQFCKEALDWQGLRHSFILPLLGIDRETFAPSFCMVSPWMKHGTVLKYLRDRGRGDVNRLLLEIAHGLDYLHSMNIIHGDLRGNNILISDDKTACLTDFGLATTIAH